MKNVSKLALFVAAGMVSAGVNAADFEVGENTTVSIFGEMEVQMSEVTDSNGNAELDFSDEGSLFGFGGEQDFGNGISAYVVGEFEYDILDESDGFDQGDGEFGIKGPFGEVAIGDVGSVAIDATWDRVDVFESTAIAEPDGSSSSSSIAYFSPEMNGLEVFLQTRISDDTDNDTTSPARDTGSDVSLIAGMLYTVGPVTFGAGYDDRGSELLDAPSTQQKDPTYGVSASADFSDRMTVTVNFNTEQDASASANDTDYTALSAVYNYGAGDIYGAVQDVSPETGDSRTEVQIGADYTIMGELNAYAEYAALDKTNDAGDLMEVGLRFEF